MNFCKKILNFLHISFKVICYFPKLCYNNACSLLTCIAVLNIPVERLCSFQLAIVYYLFPPIYKKNAFRSIETAGLSCHFDILFFNYYYWISDNDFIKNIHPVSVTDENNVVLTYTCYKVSSPSIFFAIMYDVGVHGEASIITIAHEFLVTETKICCDRQKNTCKNDKFYK